MWTIKQRNVTFGPYKGSIIIVGHCRCARMQPPGFHLSHDIGRWVPVASQEVVNADCHLLGCLQFFLIGSLLFLLVCTLVIQGGYNIDPFEIEIYDINGSIAVFRVILFAFCRIVYDCNPIHIISGFQCNIYPRYQERVL